MGMLLTRVQALWRGHCVRRLFSHLLRNVDQVLSAVLRLQAAWRRRQGWNRKLHMSQHPACPSEGGLREEEESQFSSQISAQPPATPRADLGSRSVLDTPATIGAESTTPLLSPANLVALGWMARRKSCPYPLEGSDYSIIGAVNSTGGVALADAAPPTSADASASALAVTSARGAPVRVKVNLGVRSSTIQLVGGSSGRRRDEQDRRTAPWEAATVAVDVCLSVEVIVVSRESSAMAKGVSTHGEAIAAVAGLPIQGVVGHLDARGEVAPSLLTRLLAARGGLTASKRTGQKADGSLLVSTKELLMECAPYLEVGLRFIELFAGCGGRTKGYEMDNDGRNGAEWWKGVAVERDKRCVATHSLNSTFACFSHDITPLRPFPQLGFGFPINDRPWVLSGGAPCQPFSILGKQGGHEDPREGFTATLEAVTQLRPVNVEIENVTNLMNHELALNLFTGGLRSLGYYVECYQVDASRYDVPQKRLRLLILGSLLGLPRPPTPPARLEVTVEDVLSPMCSFDAGSHPELEVSAERLASIEMYERRSNIRRTRVLDPQRPARTITCRNAGLHTNDMIRLRRDDGVVRSLTIPEVLVLQSFNADFDFGSATRTQALVMIGNSLPPKLAHHLSQHWRQWRCEFFDLVRCVEKLVMEAASAHGNELAEPVGTVEQCGSATYLSSPPLALYAEGDATTSSDSTASSTSEAPSSSRQRKQPFATIASPTFATLSTPSSSRTSQESLSSPPTTPRALRTPVGHPTALEPGPEWPHDEDTPDLHHPNPRTWHNHPRNDPPHSPSEPTRELTTPTQLRFSSAAESDDAGCSGAAADPESAALRLQAVWRARPRHEHSAPQQPSDPRVDVDSYAQKQAECIRQQLLERKFHGGPQADLQLRIASCGARGRPDFFSEATRGKEGGGVAEGEQPSFSKTAFVALVMTALTTPCGDNRTSWRKEARRKLLCHRSEMTPPRGSVCAVPTLASVSAGAEPTVEVSGYVEKGVHRSSGLHRVGTSAPAILRKLAYQCSEGGTGQRHRLRLIQDGLVDTGAMFNVFDEQSVDKWNRRGALQMVKWHKHPSTLDLEKLGVVGGGTVLVVGICTVQFAFQENVSGVEGKWHVMEVTGVVIKGPRTVILGVPFLRDFGGVPHLSERKVTFNTPSGLTFETDLLQDGAGCHPFGTNHLNQIGEPSGGIQPLVYTAERAVAKAWGHTVVDVKVSSAASDESVYILSLDPTDKSSYLNMKGLRVQEGIHQVRAGGVVRLCILNPGVKDIPLPANIPVGHFMLRPDVSVIPDLDVDAILDSLDIQGVDADQLAKRKEDVRAMLQEQRGFRQTYFSNSRTGVGTVTEFKLELKEEYRTGAKPPPNVWARPLTQEQHTAAFKLFEEMVRNGVLSPSTSAFGAPIVMVRKSDGGWRMALDFRLTNEAVVKQHYPLPKLQDCIDAIGRARYFTSLDLLSAFWQVPCEEQTREICAVNFPWENGVQRKWQFNTMAMGLQAASACMQKTVDILLLGLQPHVAIAYIDDVLVHSETWEQHLLDVALVLDRIGGAGFTFKPRKCHIGVARVKFLGFEVSAEGVRPDPDRMRSLREMSFPDSQVALANWIGLVQFYSRYVPNCAIELGPLSELQHSRSWPSSVPAECLAAFNNILNILTREESPFQRRPDFNKEFILNTDACSRGGMAILAQLDESEQEVPLAFWSRRWVLSEKRWAPLEHECGAVHGGCMHFRKYLLCRTFRCFTDAEPLVWLRSLKNPQKRLASWIADLQEFDMLVVHRPGVDNVPADRGSRLTHLMPDSVASRLVASLTPVRELETRGLNSSRSPARTLWMRVRIACVVFTSTEILTIAGSGGAHAFPSACKQDKQQPVREVAMAALQPLVLSSMAEITRFLSPYRWVVAGAGISEHKFFLVPCARHEFERFLTLHKRSSLRPRWSGISDSIRFGHTCDQRMAKRIAMLIQSWRDGTPVATHPALRSACDERLFCLLDDKKWFQQVGTTEVCVASVLEVDASSPPTRLADGRLIPSTLLDDTASTLASLRAIQHYLNACESGGELYSRCPYEHGIRVVMSVDLEWDPFDQRLDLLQVAVGPYIFIYDIHRYPDVLRRDYVEGVPSIKFLLQDPRVLKVMQACGADVCVLDRYNIVVDPCFDTAIADGIVRSRHAQEGRTLGVIMKEWTQHELEAKGSLPLTHLVFRRRPLAPLTLLYAWQDVAWCRELFFSLRAAAVRTKAESRDGDVLDLIYECSKQRCGIRSRAPISQAVLLLVDHKRAAFRIENNSLTCPVLCTDIREVRNRGADLVAAARSWLHSAFGAKCTGSLTKQISVRTGVQIEDSFVVLGHVDELLNWRQLLTPAWCVVPLDRPLERESRDLTFTWRAHVWARYRRLLASFPSSTMAGSDLGCTLIPRRLVVVGALHPVIIILSMVARRFLHAARVLALTCGALATESRREKRAQQVLDTMCAALQLTVKPWEGGSERGGEHYNQFCSEPVGDFLALDFRPLEDTSCQLDRYKQLLSHSLHRAVETARTEHSIFETVISLMGQRSSRQVFVTVCDHQLLGRRSQTLDLYEGDTASTVLCRAAAKQGLAQGNVRCLSLDYEGRSLSEEDSMDFIPKEATLHLKVKFEAGGAPGSPEHCCKEIVPPTPVSGPARFPLQRCLCAHVVLNSAGVKRVVQCSQFFYPHSEEEERCFDCVGFCACSCSACDDQPLANKKVPFTLITPRTESCVCRQRREARFSQLTSAALSSHDRRHCAASFLGYLSSRGMLQGSRPDRPALTMASSEGESPDGSPGGPSLREAIRQKLLSMDLDSRSMACPLTCPMLKELCSQYGAEVYASWSRQFGLPPIDSRDRSKMNHFCRKHSLCGLADLENHSAAVAAMGSEDSDDEDVADDVFGGCRLATAHQLINSIIHADPILSRKFQAVVSERDRCHRTDASESSLSRERSRSSSPLARAQAPVLSATFESRACAFTLASAPPSAPPSPPGSEVDLDEVADLDEERFVNAGYLPRRRGARRTRQDWPGSQSPTPSAPPLMPERLPRLRSSFQDAPAERCQQPWRDELPGFLRSLEIIGVPGFPVDDTHYQSDGGRHLSFWLQMSVHLREHVRYELSPEQWGALRRFCCISEADWPGACGSRSRLIIDRLLQMFPRASVCVANEWGERFGPCPTPIRSLLELGTPALLEHFCAVTRSTIQVCNDFARTDSPHIRVADERAPRVGDFDSRGLVYDVTVRVFPHYCDPGTWRRLQADHVWVETVVSSASWFSAYEQACLKIVTAHFVHMCILYADQRPHVRFQSLARLVISHHNLRLKVFGSGWSEEQASNLEMELEYAVEKEMIMAVHVAEEGRWLIFACADLVVCLSLEHSRAFITRLLLRTDIIKIFEDFRRSVEGLLGLMVSAPKYSLADAAAAVFPGHWGHLSLLRLAEMWFLEHRFRLVMPSARLMAPFPLVGSHRDCRLGQAALIMAIWKACVQRSVRVAQFRLPLLPGSSYRSDGSVRFTPLGQFILPSTSEAGEEGFTGPDRRSRSARRRNARRDVPPQGAVIGPMMVPIAVATASSVVSHSSPSLDMTSTAAPVVSLVVPSPLDMRRDIREAFRGEGALSIIADRLDEFRSAASPQDCMTMLMELMNALTGDRWSAVNGECSSSSSGSSQAGCTSPSSACASPPSAPPSPPAVEVGPLSIPEVPFMARQVQVFRNMSSQPSWMNVYVVCYASGGYHIFEQRAVLEGLRECTAELYPHAIPSLSILAPPIICSVGEAWEILRPISYESRSIDFAAFCASLGSALDRPAMTRLRRQTLFAAFVRHHEYMQRARGRYLNYLVLRATGGEMRPSPRDTLVFEAPPSAPPSPPPVGISFDLEYSDDVEDESVTDGDEVIFVDAESNKGSDNAPASPVVTVRGEEANHPVTGSEDGAGHRGADEAAVKGGNEITRAGAAPLVGARTVAPAEVYTVSGERGAWFGVYQRLAVHAGLTLSYDEPYFFGVPSSSMLSPPVVGTVGEAWSRLSPALRNTAEHDDALFESAATMKRPAVTRARRFELEAQKEVHWERMQKARAQLLWYLAELGASCSSLEAGASVAAEAINGTLVRVLRVPVPLSALPPSSLPPSPPSGNPLGASPRAVPPFALPPSLLPGVDSPVPDAPSSLLPAQSSPPRYAPGPFRLFTFALQSLLFFTSCSPVGSVETEEVLKPSAFDIAAALTQAGTVLFYFIIGAISSYLLAIFIKRLSSRYTIARLPPDMVVREYETIGDDGQPFVCRELASGDIDSEERSRETPLDALSAFWQFPHEEQTRFSYDGFLPVADDTRMGVANTRPSRLRVRACPSNPPSLPPSPPSAAWTGASSPSLPPLALPPPLISMADSPLTALEVLSSSPSSEVLAVAPPPPPPPSPPSLSCALDMNARERSATEVSSSLFSARPPLPTDGRTPYREQLGLFRSVHWGLSEWGAALISQCCAQSEGGYVAISNGRPFVCHDQVTSDIEEGREVEEPRPVSPTGADAITVGADPCGAHAFSPALSPRVDHLLTERAVIDPRYSSPVTDLDTLPDAPMAASPEAVSRDSMSLSSSFGSLPTLAAGTLEARARPSASTPSVAPRRSHDVWISGWYLRMGSFSFTDTVDLPDLTAWPTCSLADIANGGSDAFLYEFHAAIQSSLINNPPSECALPPAIAVSLNRYYLISIGGTQAFGSDVPRLPDYAVDALRGEPEACGIRVYTHVLVEDLVIVRSICDLPDPGFDLLAYPSQTSLMYLDAQSAWPVHEGDPFELRQTKPDSLDARAVYCPVLQFFKLQMLVVKQLGFTPDMTARIRPRNRRPIFVRLLDHRSLTMIIDDDTTAGDVCFRLGALSEDGRIECGLGRFSTPGARLVLETGGVRVHPGHLLDLRLLFEGHQLYFEDVLHFVPRNGHLHLVGSLRGAGPPSRQLPPSSTQPEAVGDESESSSSDDEFRLDPGYPRWYVVSNLSGVFLLRGFWATIRPFAMRPDTDTWVCMSEFDARDTVARHWPGKEPLYVGPYPGLWSDGSLRIPHPLCDAGATSASASGEGPSAEALLPPSLPPSPPSSPPSSPSFMPSPPLPLNDIRTVRIHTHLAADARVPPSVAMIRALASVLGTERAEVGTLRAVHAVALRMCRPDLYPTARDARHHGIVCRWDGDGEWRPIPERTFRYYSRKWEEADARHQRAGAAIALASIAPPESPPSLPPSPPSSPPLSPTSSPATGEGMVLAPELSAALSASVTSTPPLVSLPSRDSADTVSSVSSGASGTDCQGAEALEEHRSGEGEETIYFYSHEQGPWKCFSQWFYSPFVNPADGVEYSCGEQFMMAKKAAAMGDVAAMNAILSTGYAPAQVKALGRRVSGFDQDRWELLRFEIVLRGNQLKFAQNEDLRRILLATGNALLAEASTRDTIWGIGLSVEKAEAGFTWCGQNLLGKVLMKVRRDLRAKEIIRSLVAEGILVPTAVAQRQEEAALVIQHRFRQSRRSLAAITEGRLFDLLSAPQCSERSVVAAVSVQSALSMAPESADISNIVVILHNDSHVLLLRRDPGALRAQSSEATLALPFVKHVGAVRGRHAAQLALRNCIGPLMEEGTRDFRRAIQNIQLRGALLRGGKREPGFTALYEVQVGENFECFSLWVSQAFERRCATPTLQALFPAFAVSDKQEITLSALQPLDARLLGHILDPVRCSQDDPLHSVCEWSLEVPPSFRFNPVYEADEAMESLLPPSEAPATLTASIMANFSSGVVNPPPGSAQESEGDIADRQSRPTRRALSDTADGADEADFQQEGDAGQPTSGMDAEFESHSRSPRVRNILGFIARLFPDQHLVMGEELKQHQRADPFCSRWISYLEEGVLPAQKKTSKTMVDSQHYFCMRQGLLARFISSQTDLEEPVLVLPQSQVDAYLQASHDLMGHPGVRRTLAFLQQRVWFPSMYRAVHSFVLRCPTCAFNKEVPAHGAMHTPENGDRPWACVQVDVVYLEPTAAGLTSAIVFACRYIHDVDCFPCSKSLTSEEFLNVLTFDFAPKHGWPRRLFSDRGSNLISQLCSAYYRAMRMQHDIGDSYMHTVVGLCERFNATLREFARAIYFDQQCQWDLYLPLLVLMYRSMPDPDLGYSLFYLDHGREPVLPWELSVEGPSQALNFTTSDYVRRIGGALHAAWHSVHGRHLREELARRQKHAAKYRTNVSFEKGDLVLVKHSRRLSKMEMPYVGPFRVEEVLERDRYRLRDRNNVKQHNEFSVKRLKPYPHNADGVLDPGDDYYRVDHIVDRRLKHDGSHFEYRLRWVGYAAGDDTWVASQDCNGALLEEIGAYNLRNPLPSASASSPSGTSSSANQGASSSSVAPPTEAPSSMGQDTSSATSTAAPTSSAAPTSAAAPPSQTLSRSGRVLRPASSYMHSADQLTDAERRGRA